MRTVTKINEGWYFTKNPVEITKLSLDEMEKVNLPHTWNALDGQDGGDDYYRGLCVYAYELEKPQTEDQIYLEFSAVSQTAKVYVNGQEAGRHEGGFSIFRVNITNFLKEGKNLVAVSADNGENERTYPQFADFTFYGGIYRNVNLITVSKQHFELDYIGAPGIAVTPVVQEGRASITVQGYAKAEGVVYHYEIREADGNLVCEADSEETGVVFRIENPHLWNGVKDPYLYTAKIQMKAEGIITDEVTARFGIRSFSVDPEKGFFLNGESLPLRGVSRHQCREDKGWALSLEDQRQDMELIAEMGANTIRLAHYQHSQEFYNLCDEFGMIVWAEIPFISQFMGTEAAYHNTMSQMKELICQNYNHPSICFWGISNEISMSGEEDEDLLKNLRDLNALCHELDATRLTTLANLSMVDMDSSHNSITDVLSYNHYFGWYMGEVEENGPWLDEFHRRHPGTALGLSEYGAEGNVNLHSETPQVRDYSEEYHCVYHEGMLKTFAARPYLWSTHVWNMFEFGSDMRDEGGVAGRNNKGLVNFSRTIKKDAFYLYKAYWTKAPFIYLCGRRFEDRYGQTRIKAYGTGIDEVALFIGKEEHGRLSGEHIFSFEEILLPMGRNKITAVGYLEGKEICRDTIDLNGVEKPREDYRLPEEAEGETGEGVTNWFSEDYKKEKQMPAKENCLSAKDKINDIMQNPQGAAVMNELMEKMAAGMGAGKGKSPIMGGSMMKMLGNMSLEQVIKMAGKKVPAGALSMINQMLSQISKE